MQVTERPRTISDDAHDQISKSLSRGERLLTEGHGREAVQETLWLLESVTTAFRNIQVGEDASIGGKYFNKIVRELRDAQAGTTLELVLNWTTSLDYRERHPS